MCCNAQGCCNLSYLQLVLVKRSALWSLYAEISELKSPTDSHKQQPPSTNDVYLLESKLADFCDYRQYFSYIYRLRSQTGFTTVLGKGI